MDRSNEYFMKRAIELSKIGMDKNAGGPFGAIIVKDGKIISEGYNQVTSKNDVTAHAEIEAIRKACNKLNSFQLDGCTLYTSCEPCPMCLGAIYWSRIDKVFYANTKTDAAEIGFADNFIYNEIDLDINKRRIPFKQKLRIEALTVFQEWKEKDNKIEY